MRVRAIHNNSDIAHTAPQHQGVKFPDLPPPAVELDLFCVGRGHTGVHPPLAEDPLVHSDKDHVLDDWVQCDRCHAWRHPQPGTFQIILNSEATFS